MCSLTEKWVASPRGEYLESCKIPNLHHIYHGMYQFIVNTVNIASSNDEWLTFVN